jgi:hypothetical protein
MQRENVQLIPISCTFPQNRGLRRLRRAACTLLDITLRESGSLRVCWQAAERLAATVPGSKGDKARSAC